jgi:hypothetical protein
LSSLKRDRFKRGSCMAAFQGSDRECDTSVGTFWIFEFRRFEYLSMHHKT